MRLSRFYQAVLSESIGYAEVDLESGQLKSAGGLWPSYREKCLQTGQHFLDLLCEKLQNVYGLLCLRDINAQKQREDEQIRAANHDPLTGIFNRAAFEQAVADFVRSRTETPCGILILLDVDNFKMINDQMGHLKGDEALRVVSHVLLTVFGKESIIGRLGGDEFLAFVYNCSPDGLMEKFDQLLNQLQTSQTFSISSSIGATFVSPENFNYIQSLHEADTALYYCKKNGKNQFRFYHEFPPQEKR